MLIPGNPAQRGMQFPSFSTPYVPDPTQGESVEMTLTGNVTINVPTASCFAGQRLLLLLVQDGTGGRTITFGAGFKVASGWTPSTTASKVNSIEFVFDGTNWIQVAGQVGM